MASNGMKIAIVGGGLAGLAAAMKIAEGGHAVDLFSVVPVKRSHSVCAQGGINGAVNTKGEGDSTWEHFDDTVYGGDFLAEPTTRQGHVRNGAFDQSTYSIAWAFPSPGPTKVCSTFVALAERNTTVRLLPEHRPDNSCCTRSTNKFDVMRSAAK